MNWGLGGVFKVRKALKRIVCMTKRNKGLFSDKEKCTYSENANLARVLISVVYQITSAVFMNNFWPRAQVVRFIN